MPKISVAIVIGAIEQALMIESGMVRDSTSAEEIEAWDSLGHLSIVVALDKLFDGQLARIGEIADANSVPKIVTVLTTHGLL